MSRADAPVVIVGGGISGLSVACELARSRIPTVVLDSHTIGGAASTSNQGWLHSGAWFAPRDVALARLCYASLQQTLARYPECLQPDTEPMAFLLSRPDTDAEAYLQAWREAGIPCDEWPLDELCGQLPRLRRTEVQRAFRLPDRAFRPEVLMTRLMETAEKLGAEIRLGVTVTRLCLGEGTVTGVAAGTEEIPARLVILAGNAGGAFLWPKEVGDDGTERPPPRRLFLRTHLVAGRPELGPVPLCILDEEGLNHVPTQRLSIFGIDRWRQADASSGSKVVPEEVERLWETVERFFPDYRRAERESSAWPGTTVQAWHVGQPVPQEPGWPMVIDHSRESPQYDNLLTVFPGRASLWASLAEECRQTVLAKL